MMTATSTLTTDIWKPRAHQVPFLASPADEALFGGAAGPGKSDCLLMEALRQIWHPLYTAVIFRRTYKMLKGADGLWERARRWYPLYGATSNESDMAWTFPSGAKIYFSHLQHESDVGIYQGWQICFLAFDELTEFFENHNVYTYLLARNRVPHGSGLRAYTRSATNPGMVGHEWVKNRFVTRGIVNRVGYFATVDDKDIEVDKNHPQARSRAFYPATIIDDPYHDSEYLKILKNTPDAVRRAQLLEGDWDAEYRDNLVYANWSTGEAGNISELAEYKPDLPVIWGVDDGYAEGQGRGTKSYHPRVILLMQRTPIGGLDVFAEYVETGVASYDTTVEAVESWSYRPPSEIYVDSSAAMFRGALWNRGYQTVSATHKVVEGIRNVRRMIGGPVTDKDGNVTSILPRLIRVHPRCQYTIWEISKYENDPNLKAPTGELVPKKLNDHTMDALRYAAWSMRYE